MRLSGESTAGGVQPYKYNGKELDRMHGPDLFDYGARHYDAAVGRWWNADPLAEMYYSISPYAYVANNPVNRIDPDGRDILIWYRNSEGKNVYYRFTGNFAHTFHSSEFVNSFMKSYIYDVQNGGGIALQNAAKDKSININLQYFKFQNSYSTGTVYWNPKSGLKTLSGDVLSPATILEHEMDHAYDDAKNPKFHAEQVNKKIKDFTNEEEKRVILGNESKTAKANREIENKKHSRLDHEKGQSVIVERDVTSTKVNHQKTEKYENERKEWLRSWSSEY